MMFHEQMNPYKFAMGKVYRVFNKDLKEKILWDFKSVAKKSKKNFRQLENSHKGEKAVILCNGPSLIKTDFSLLDNVFTIGLNKINLLFNDFTFRPSMVIAFDKLLNSQNVDFLASDPLKIPKIVTYKSYPDLKIDSDEIIYMYHVPDSSFCYRPIEALIDRSHTTYMAFQIAYFMGFEKIALIGADHNFPDDKPRQKVLNEGDDKLHFHKDYHKAGTKTQNTDRYLLDMNFRDARIAFENKGRTIVNATEGGCLNVFERMSLADFIHRF